MFFLLLKFLLLILFKKITIKKWEFYEIMICFSFKKRIKDILVYMDLQTLEKGGPGAFARSLAKNSLFYNGKCDFFIKDLDEKEITSNCLPNVYYYIQSIQKQSFFSSSEKNYCGNIIFGPNIIPVNWFSFPNKSIEYEKNWRYYLKKMRGYIVHSKRVFYHISKRSKTADMKEKYIFFPTCADKPVTPIKSFKKRKYDILFYEKYADVDYMQNGTVLIELLKKKYKIKRISYINGKYYNKNKLLNFANNSRFLIYYSFYDTGAIALMEMQNYGIFTFSLQSEFLDIRTGILIESLNNDHLKSFIDISMMIDKLLKKEINSTKISEINSRKNNCENSIDFFCKQLTK